MKGGGLYGLRGKQLSLTLIGLVCATILIWAWENTPLLTSFLPPQNRFLMPPPEIFMSAPTVSSKPSTHNVNEEISNKAPENEALAEQDEQSSNVAVPVNSTLTSTTGKAYGKSMTTDVQEKDKDPKLKNMSEGEMRPKHEEQSVTVVAAPNSENSSSAVKGKDDGNLTSHLEKKACNYAKGRWVTDNKRPLYSGFGCKQWLSEMWACRLTQRTDFSYESFRWQPENCEMPEFEGSKLLKRMQDKTIAIVGDSLGRQQFQSLMCMVTGGKERQDFIDVGVEFGLVKARGAPRPDGWAYRCVGTNTTILYYWSACLCDLEPIDITNPATDYAMHLDRPTAFLRRYLHRFDVLVLNTGHHWNRGKLKANRWVMHVGGVPNTNRKIAEIGGAKNFTIYSVVKWVDSQLPKHSRLNAFFRTISPRHFFNGDWNTGGSCDNTTPLSGAREVLQDNSSDPVAEGAVKGTRVKLLDITALSQLRDEGHISRYSIRATPGVQDCLHWCLPGIPDTWNEILFAQLY